MDDSSFDGSLHFLGAFPSQTDMTISISDTHVGLESGSLSGLGLLLDGFDLNDFFSHLLFDVLFGEEKVNDFEFLDGNGESEDGFQTFDLSGFDESSELGDGFPRGIITSSSSWSFLLFSTFFLSSEVISSSSGVLLLFFRHLLVSFFIIIFVYIF